VPLPLDLSAVTPGLVPGVCVGWMAVTSTRLSGSVFVDRVHGIDSTRFGTLANDPGHEEGSTPCFTRIAFFTKF
jgi:hypothetical protein